jgi:hypothetical protein
MRIASDPTRRLFIEGAGIVERPLEVTPELTGWSAPTVRAYTYRAGQVVDGESADDEMVMLVLRGDIDLEAAGLERRCRRADPFATAPVALYLPPGETYRASVRGNSHVLYCRAPAEGRRPARIVGDADGEVISAAIAERVRVREHRVAAGTWAALPLGAEGGSITYHRFSKLGGWALCPERARAGVPSGAIAVRDGDALVNQEEIYELAVSPGADLLAVVVTAAG